MIFKNLCMLTVIGTITACTSTEITQHPIEYTPKHSLNEKGTTSFTFRTFSKASGSRKELSGVDCKLNSSSFHSSFVTPAEVTAPDMGTRTPVASIECVHDGEEKIKILEPYNKTISDINSQANTNAAANGLIGAFIGGIAAGVQKSKRDPSEDIYSYRDGSVVFADGE